MCCLQVHGLFQRNVIFALAVIHFKRSHVVTRESGDESVQSDVTASVSEGGVQSERLVLPLMFDVVVLSLDYDS